jgi:hypothetical protein
MSKNLISPPGYDEPDATPVERNASSIRCLALSMLAFWVCVIFGALALYSCNAQARTQVYLEQERDLGNGYKLCIYNEGVTITVPAYRLCPISINVED